MQVPPDAGLVAEKLKEMSVLGYTRFPELVPPDQAAAALARIQALHAAGKNYPHADGIVIANLQSKDPWFISALEIPLLEQVLMGTLNDPYYRVIPEDQPNYILGEYIARASSDKALRLHIDSWLPVPGPRTWMVQAAIALEDRGIAEGCSIIVPGSHVTGTFTDREFPSTVSVPLKAGDVVLWDSRLGHGAHARTSAREGWALIATFQMWWVKPRFDITRSLPPEIYERLTQRQKALLGFCSQPPYDEYDGPQKKGYADLK